MDRLSLKIVGASGQGIISVGEILARAFKRSGRCVFGYREYMSLIKGGHGSYQIDVSNRLIRGSEERVDVLISLNHHGFEKNVRDLKDGGLIIHDTDRWNFPPEDTAFLEERRIRVLYLPVGDILKRLQAKPILSNVVFSAFAWSALGGDIDLLKALVSEKFKRKKDLLDLNMRAIDEGVAYRKEHAADLEIPLPPSDPQWEKRLLLTGSNAMGLGLIHGGMRCFVSYPMTPASPLLSYVAEVQNETGVLVKQAEDEITAAQMMSGAMFAGTRAATATSGGGFDLMTETLSLNGIAENPAVFILAQRPGPGTGLPTWTAQGDLLLAVNAGHGEFARAVLAVSDAADAFTLMNNAFNAAEEFQTPVIILTDKHIAEGIFTQEPYPTVAPDIRRGKLVTDPVALRALKADDRYDPQAQDGISLRWLPGSEAAVYAGQGDEHRGDGSVDESGENALRQIEKRMKKLQAMRQRLPDPTLFMVRDGKAVPVKQNENVDLLLIGWGSTKGAVLDAMEEIARSSKPGAHSSVGYLHYTWLWPVKGERFEELQKRARKTALVEGNFQGQLGMLLRQETGIAIQDRILKFDGRPFFREELLSRISALCS